jgi:general secretion pathway protein G
MNGIHRLTASTLLLLVLAGLPAGCGPSRANREAALRTNLATLRNVLAQYRGDKGHDAATLQDLVAEGYLRRLPVDPFTGRNDTWVPVHAPGRGIQGVHSGSGLSGSDGRSYSQW